MAGESVAEDGEKKVWGDRWMRLGGIYVQTGSADRCSKADEEGGSCTMLGRDWEPWASSVSVLASGK